MKKIFKDVIVMIFVAYSQQFLRQSYDHFWIIIMASGISAVVEQSTRDPKFKSSNRGEKSKKSLYKVVEAIF
jgi:hypothetical protein